MLTRKPGNPDWRLSVPESWDETCVPDKTGNPPLLIADAGYGQVAEFRQGRTDRGIAYIVATTCSTTAQPGDAEPVVAGYAGVGPYPTPRYPRPARSIKDLALAVGADRATLAHRRERLPAAGSTSPRSAWTPPASSPTTSWVRRRHVPLLVSGACVFRRSFSLRCSPWPLSL